MTWRSSSIPGQNPQRRAAKRARPAARSVGMCLAWLALSAAQASAATSSMTVVAPDMITDRTRAEARVSIRNSHSTPQTYDLELYVDTPLGRQSLATTAVNVPANGQALHSSWFSTKGLGGANTVRYRITGGGESEMTGAWPMTVVASQTRAVPLITAAWFDPGAVLPGVYPLNRAMNAQDVRNEIDAAHAVGIDTLIISYAEYVLNNWGSFYPSQNFSSVASFDVVGTILNQASKNGQRVMIGLGRGNDLYLTYNGFNDPQRNAAALAHDTLVANELWSLYQHEPSFYGWYLSHEANEIGPASTAYYNNTVDMLRGIVADKPVMISPSGTPVISPSILSNSKVDVFAYQDAVGAGYIPYQYTYDPQQRIATLNSVFGSYAAAHNNVNKHLWANLENWQMNGPAYANAYPADVSRVLQQLDIEKNYVDVITSYEWFGFAEHPASTVRMNGVRAVNFYNGYRDYYRQTKAGLKTVNYTINGGFEDGGPADGTAPPGWTFAGDGLTQRVAYSGDTPSATETAVDLHIDQDAGLPWLIQDVPVTSGFEYQFSAWAKRLAADPSGGQLAAQVWMLADDASSSILQSTALLFTASTWEFKSSLITAPAEATVARIIIGLQDSAFGVGTGRYLFDGVALVGPDDLLPGDFDHDGAVEGADFLTWQREFPFGLDETDLALWRQNFGEQSQQFAPDVSAVPEPTGLTLFTACTLMLNNARSRRASGRRNAGAARRFSSAALSLVGIHAALAGCLVGGIVVGSAVAATPAEPSRSERPYAASMTVVPPGPISDKIEFEVRVAVRNNTSTTKRFELSLAAERDGTTHPLIATPLEVPANGQELFVRRFPAGEHRGAATISYKLKGPEKFEASESWPLAIVASESRALPFIQFGWLDPGAVVPGGYPQQRPMTEQDVRDGVDACRDLGMTGLIITYPESIYSGQGFYYPSHAFAEHRAHSFDVVGTILNQASKNGQRVFVGLGRGPDLLLTWTGFDDRKRISTSLAHSMKVAAELWGLYGREPSFYGWYLSHEANDIAQASRAYYNPMVDYLRTFEADKPVLISPSGTPILSREILRKSKVDVFAYQDAVGSGYVPYENTFEPQRRIAALPDVYAGYAAAHQDAGKHLWTNLEIWEMAGPEYANSYPPMFERVKTQLDIEKEHADVITSYEVFGFMERPESPVALGGPKAIALFKAYQKYYQTVAERLGLNATP